MGSHPEQSRDSCLLGAVAQLGWGMPATVASRDGSTLLGQPGSNGDGHPHTPCPLPGMQTAASALIRLQSSLPLPVRDELPG